MSAQHTQGPIRYDHEPGYCGELIARDGMTVAAFFNEPSEADARRLVACWNACDGLPTESLECGKPPADQIVDALNQRHELMAQRDELLEVLQGVVPELEYMAGGMTHAAWKTTEARKRLDSVRAVIAKATGGAT